MDAKITKLRLSRMLSYDWLKMVAVALAAIIVWVLIFTMSATRITPAQRFTVINYEGNYSIAYSNFSKNYNEAFSNGVFSHEVIEVGSYDLTTAPDYAQSMLQAYLETDDGDVMFVSQMPNEGYEYTDGNGQTQKATYLDSLVLGYYYYLYDLDLENENGYFRQMEKYLAGYYTDGDFTNPETLNKAKIEQDFRTRIDENNDKRYKNDEQVQAGIKGEIERIQKYSAALIEFYGYLDEGLISLTKTELTAKTYDGTSYTLKGTFSINLCPDESKMGKLVEIASYVGKKTDENGVEQKTLMAKDMNLAILDVRGMEEGFQYESLLYINQVIRYSRTDVASAN